MPVRPLIAELGRKEVVDEPKAELETPEFKEYALQLIDMIFSSK